MRYLFLACGQFPEEFLRDLGNEAYWTLVEVEGPVLTDFPAYHLPLGSLTPPRVQTIGFDYWQDFDCIIDYFKDLIQPWDEVRPACVLAVDALASRALSRVCRTIQLADTGIVPGSGVGNARAALNREKLGVPVIAIGVPTVVDAGTLAADVLSQAGGGELPPEVLGGAGGGLVVTPKDIDQSVADLSKVIGYGINLALQPHLTVEDVDMLLS